MTFPIKPETGILLIRLGADIVAGDVKDGIETARKLMGVAVDMIPVDELKEFLSNQDRIFADLSVDVAEQIKLEGEKPGS